MKELMESNKRGKRRRRVLVPVYLERFSVASSPVPYFIFYILFVYGYLDIFFV